MRSLIVLILLPAVLAQACATAATPEAASAPASAAVTGASRAPDPGKLQEITEDLVGEPATIELASGEVVQKALSVRLGTEVTSWRDASGRERTVPTAEVRRVLREQRRLIGRGFGYGAAAGVLPGYLVAQSQCHRDCSFAPFASEGAYVGFFLTIIAGGVIGMAVAAANRHPVVVYAAPAAQNAQNAATPASSSIRHCRLPAAATGDVLDCGLAAR